MAESSTPPFVMYGAREAMAGGLSHVEEQVNGIEQAIVENPALAFDLAKTLVESACRTILRERKVPFSESDDLPKLFKAVGGALPFLPPTASGEVGIRESLARTLGGLSGAIQGVCELRNRCGFASHGSDKPRPAMETIQALLAAESADTIVGFIYCIHRQDRRPRASPQELYEGNSAFNDAVDEAYGPIRIFEVDFRPSEVLAQLEPETYRIYLAEFEAEAEHGSSDTRSSLEAAP